jgi:integrase
MPSAIVKPPPAELATVDHNNPVLVYMGRLSKGSHKAQAWALWQAAKWLGKPSCVLADVPRLPWTKLRYPHLVTLRSYLADRYAPATASRIMAAVRGVLREAANLDQYPEDEFQKLGRLEAIRGARPLRGRCVAAGELRALFLACERNDLGARDAAALALLYGCGLRRHELSALGVQDVDFAAGTVRARGKGRKWRLVPMPAGTIKACEAWLRRRGFEPGPFIYAGTYDRKLAPIALHPDGINRLLSRLARRAGCKLSPHDLRRSYVSDLLDAGSDLATVQALVGHASADTTAQYDRRGEYTRAKAASKLAVPYQD